MFISRHVPFHENICPFQNNASQNYMSPVPNPQPSASHRTFDDNWFIQDELEPIDTPHIPNTPTLIPSLTNSLHLDKQHPHHMLL